MQPSQVLAMGLAAGAHLMDKAHLASSTTTNPATDTNTSSVTTDTAPIVRNSTVWVTTTMSATTQFVTAPATSNATVTPSTSWVTATVDATTISVDWTVYPAVPITLTTSTSPSSPTPISSPASAAPVDPQPTESGPAIDPEPQPSESTPTLEGPWCNVESEFPHHDYQAQILQRFVEYSAHKFCDRWKENDMTPESNELSADSRDENDTQYHYFLSWDKGCTHPDGIQNIGRPLGDDGPSCKKLFTDINKKCHKSNHGVGGMYKAGCLKYEFIGGKLPS